MESVDVVVVGAGVAGLACAQELLRQQASVVVLEARSRVGGRIWTARLPGEPPVELGAQVVHGDRARTWEVIHQGGLRTVPQLDPGEVVFSVGGVPRHAADLIAEGHRMPWIIEAELAAADAAPAGSVAEVLAASTRTGLEQLIALEWLAQTWCASPDRLSAAGLWRMRRAWSSGSGEFLLLDGYDNLPRQLADGLEVRLRTPVHAVRWGCGRVRVETAAGAWRARAAVLTVPPAVLTAGSIRFDPRLPDTTMRAAEMVGSGDAIVVAAYLTEPAPRSALGLTVSTGFLRVQRGSHVLLGWVRGPAAGRLRAQGLNGRLMTRLAQEVFPWLLPCSVQDEVLVADWGTDPWSRGGYSHPAAAAPQASDRLAAPVAHTLFFAGEATCGDVHRPLVQGAMESGVRAAAEASAALTRTDTR